MEAKEGHIEYVHRAATYLMQKCEEDDAVRIEAELSDFEQVCALIGAKLASNHSRLRTVSMGKVRARTRLTVIILYLFIYKVVLVGEALDDRPPAPFLYIWGSQPR